MTWTSDDILESIGLQRLQESTILGSLSLFGAGMVVGAGLGLMFAPKPGRELRQDAMRYAEDLRNRLPEQVNNMIGQAEEAVAQKTSKQQQRAGQGLEAKPPQQH
jgi:gas vesicle protein